MNELHKLAEKWEGGGFLHTRDAYATGFNDATLQHITALRAALAKDGWQPIETAPKDGTEILAWGYLPEDWGYSESKWTLSIAFWSNGGWISQATNMRARLQIKLWQPLPTPPTE